MVGVDAGNVGFSTSGAVGNFATKNVGNGIAVTTSGFTLNGTGASNYTLAQPNGLAANITPAPLSIAITGNPTRVYNGSVNTSLTASDVQVTGWQGGEGGSVAQSSSAVYDSADAGGRIVNAHIEASDFKLTGGASLSNYTYSNNITGAGTISKAPLSWQIVGNPTKVYDGNTDATLDSNNYQVYGFVSGESATVNQTHGSYDSPNAGVRGVSAAVTTANFVAGNGTNLANYVLPTTISGSGFIYQADGSKVTVTIINNPSRAYNGTNVATLNSSNFLVSTAGGFPTGEGFTISKTSGTYASKNVGSQPVTVFLSQSDYVPIGTTNPNNYTPFATVAYGTGEITQAILTASIVGNPTKVYNGTTYIALTPANYQIDGFALDEGADIVPSKAIAFDTKNVGTGKTITAQMATTSYLAHANTDLSNYVLADTATGPGSITAAPLFILGVSAQNKVYDTNTNAVLNTAGARLIGLVGADTGNVTLVNSTTGIFDSENAGARTVTANGFGLSGSESGNYLLQQPTGLTATITPYTLNITGVKTINKDYDGTTQIMLDNSGATLGAVLAGDENKVALADGSSIGNTRAANAATGLSVSTSGYSLTGDRAGNYRVNQVSGLTADINRKQLTATIIGNPTKPYDGSTSVTLTATDYSLGGFATGEGATVPQSSTAAYLSKNAGTNVGLTSTLSVSDFVATGSTNLANYILPTGATGTGGVITPFVIKLTGARQYNGLATADAALFSTAGRINGVNGEKITLGGYGTMSSKNVGTNTLTDVSTFVLGNDTGLAQNYSVIGSATISRAPLSLDNTSTVDDHTYDGLRNAIVHPGNFVGRFGSDVLVLVNGTTGTFVNANAGNGKAVANTMSVSGTDANNYTFTAPTLTGNILKKDITVDALGINKVYDGTRTATATLSSSGRVGSDDLTYGYSALFDTKDVGNNKGVAVTGIVLNGAARNNYNLLVDTASTTANVTARPISFDGTRVYDLGNSAGAVFVTNRNALSGGVAGETLTLGGTGTLSSKNVGNYAKGGANNLDISQFTLTGNGATLASNYTFVGGTQTFHVTPYTVVVGATGIDKVYDATTAAMVNLLPPTLLGADVVNFSYGSAAFGNKNAGNGKQVNVAGITASGADAGNYAFNTTTTTTANITRLGITGTIAATDKVYDGGTAATTGGTLVGVIGSDDVRYTGTTGTFSDKNVGDKVVTVGGSIGGADANNYIVTQNTTATAKITPLAILIGATAADKMYDGLAGTTVTGVTPTGFVGGDDIAFSATTAVFDDANAATGKHVTVSGIAGSGTDIGNYTWNTVADTTATISPYILSLHGTRQYDGGTTIAASAFTPDFQVAGINGDVLTLSGAASVGDKNVGTQKPLTSLGTLGLQGNGSALSSNYTLLGGTHWATITPKQIVVDATGSTKVYDANTLATAALSSTGIVGGDQVVFTGGSTLYDTKNVGTGKAVTVTGIVASGTDAANYAYNGTALTTGDITPLAITGTIGADSKTYDGTTLAQTHGALTGVLAGDHLGVATNGDFADKNAGNGKTVNVAGSLTGVDAGNYTLSTNATTTADIRKVVLDLTGTRVYDGSTVAGAGMFGNQGVVAGITGESLTLSGNGVLATKNVATGRDIAGLGTLALSGNGATLAGNYTLVGGHHVATVTPLGISASIGADDKVYDGNTSATTHGVLNGVLGGDDVALSTGGRFVDKNAGQGKTVDVTGDIGGGDASNYVLTYNPVTTASITKRQIAVTAVGTDKFFDGNRADLAVLGTDGILPGDVVNFVAGSALFADPSIGLDKTVSVDGISATGVDAGNYAFNTSTTAIADINQNPSQGASATALTQIDAVLNPDSIATPHGVASNVTVGQYSGNHKKTRQPIEKNVRRADFTPGLSLQVVEGGVRLPSDAMH
ncbi:MAG: YDG domain-containing protein [Luteibacter sp.]